jgi:hypothetical protein
MDALDDLVPSAMKSQQRRRPTVFSLEHSGGLNESNGYSTLGDNGSSFVDRNSDECFSPPVEAEESGEALVGESHSFILEHDSNDPSASSAADASDELDVLL